MTDTHVTTAPTQDELAHLGEGNLAYFRRINSDDLKQRFPELPPIAAGLDLWALFAANGEPILLSDARDQVLAGAQENNLIAVSIH